MEHGIRKTLKFLGSIAIYGFAITGFVLVIGYLAVRYGFTDTPGIIDRQTEEFLKIKDNTDTAGQPLWARSEEWETLKSAVVRDEKELKRAEKDTGVPARLIFANLAVEQLRLYHSNRELFKKAFYPLKLLGNQSQFSWGVMGLKQETARQIEVNLKNPSSHQNEPLPLEKGEYSTSPFYLGEKYEHLLDFKTDYPNNERFVRIIDEDNRYYSYLYSGLYFKQVIEQWKNAGFPIDDRPEILSTLFNIGFEHSAPKQNPQVGGSVIEIAGKTYSFGGLAGEIFFSNELEKEFPR